MYPVLSHSSHIHHLHTLCEISPDPYTPAPRYMCASLQRAEWIKMCFVDWCPFSIHESNRPLYVSSHSRHALPIKPLMQLHESTNSCTFTVALHEFTDSCSHRPCYSHVSFIAHFVDSCNWAWQLTWPCGGPMLLGRPACRNTALWLEEARLGWMSTVHRAESTKAGTGTPPFIFCSVPLLALVNTRWVGHRSTCLSHQSSLFSGYTFVSFYYSAAIEKRIWCKWSEV